MMENRDLIEGSEKLAEKTVVSSVSSVRAYARGVIYSRQIFFFFSFSLPGPGPIFCLKTWLII